MAERRHWFRVRNFDLALTLDCGQAFRWERDGDGWAGVAGRRWVRLAQTADGLEAQTAEAVEDWRWLAEYLQADTDLPAVLASFPADAPMQKAVAACSGLRLLRQEPWECLASFLLSSTKQIVQIRQVIARLCQRFGEVVPSPADHAPAHAFPSAARLAQATEAELRECRMGFRAPYLRETARRVAAGEANLEDLEAMPLPAAREELMRLPGVGPKIADCVLLFACGHRRAFPLDVWIMRGLRQLYFPRRRVTLKRMRQFAAGHFGPNAGFAQQYLFHYLRVRSRQTPPVSS